MVMSMTDPDPLTLLQNRANQAPSTSLSVRLDPTDAQLTVAVEPTTE